MNRLSVEDLKKIQINILDEVAAFCDANKINYWLDGGTLLGAIRHNGYIPWDDDIDVGMLRDDFERFLKSFNLSNDRYKVYSIDSKSDFFFAHGKVLDKKTTLYEPDEKSLKLCVNIDIVPYDNAPDDEKLIKKSFARRDFYRNCNTLRNLRNHPNGNLVRRTLIRLLRLCLKPFPSNYFARKMSENAKKYNNIKTERVGNFTSFTRAVCDKKVFDTFDTHIFEGRHYKIPGGVDEWLRAFYGDYMEYPPIEEQVSHHTFVAYMNQ